MDNDLCTGEFVIKRFLW